MKLLCKERLNKSRSLPAGMRRPLGAMVLRKSVESELSIPFTMSLPRQIFSNALSLAGGHRVACLLRYPDWVLDQAPVASRVQ
jgi:hypothetical protein